MKEVLEFYLQTSIYTNYDPYKEYYQTLPNDIKTLANLVKSQIIHRSELRQGCLHHNQFLLFPWYRYRAEDDILMTAPAMTAELFRLNKNGFVKRPIEEKLVLTCRYAAVLMVSILKSKKIPARCRSGFSKHTPDRKTANDHWIVEYWDNKQMRFIRVDVSRITQVNHYNLYDIPKGIFDTAAEAWLNVRTGKRKIEDYRRGHRKNLTILAQALFHDFHALMNDEISYRFTPPFISTEEKVNNLTTEELKDLDQLAKLMLDPDQNHEKLKKIFETNVKYRILNSPLVQDEDHLETERSIQKWTQHSNTK